MRFLIVALLFSLCVAVRAGQLWMLTSEDSQIGLNPQVGVCNTKETQPGQYTEGPMGCSQHDIQYTVLPILKNESYGTPVIFKGPNGQIHLSTYWTDSDNNQHLEVYQTGYADGAACIGDKPLFDFWLEDLNNLISASWNELDNAYTVVYFSNNNLYRSVTLFMSMYPPPAAPIQGAFFIDIPRPSILPSDAYFSATEAVLVNGRVYIAIQEDTVGVLAAYDLNFDNFTIIVRCGTPSASAPCVISGLSRGVDDVLYFTQGKSVVTYDSIQESLHGAYPFVVEELSHEGGAVETCKVNGKMRDCLYWTVTKQHRLAAGYFAGSGAENSAPIVRPSQVIRDIVFGNQGPLSCSNIVV